MVKTRRKSRLPRSIQEELIKQFVAGATARSAADLVGVNRHTATLESVPKHYEGLQRRLSISRIEARRI